MDKIEAENRTNEKLRELKLIRARETWQLLNIPIIITGTSIVISSILTLYEVDGVDKVFRIISAGATIATAKSISKSFSQDTKLNNEIKRLKKIKAQLRRGENPYEKVLVYERKTHTKV